MSLPIQRAPRSEPVHTPDLIEVSAPLPPALAAFGPELKASLCGSPDAPLVVLLGGISADRFPCLRPDGSKGWWKGLAGTGSTVDPGRFRVLGIDFGADAHGRIAPSTRDQAAMLCAVLDAISVRTAYAIIGASYGGMTALALGQHFADRAERLVVISADAQPHPVATAMRELQRRIVALGIAGGRAAEGLSIARGLAMTTYRTRGEFEMRFAGGICGEDVLSCSEPGAYLRARGDAYASIMSPERFLSLSASIDRHKVNPAKVRLPTLLIGAQSDLLVPPLQMATLAGRLAGPHALHLLPSFYGHDMFLKDAATLAEIIAPFLEV